MEAMVLFSSYFEIKISPQYESGYAAVFNRDEKRESY